jgi:hypothetical protein
MSLLFPGGNLGETAISMGQKKNTLTIQPDKAIMYGYSYTYIDMGIAHRLAFLFN